MNLQKMDPTTGAILWQTLISDPILAPAGLNPIVVRIEPLRGTNHILAGVVAGTLNAVFRVDDTGSIMWAVGGHSGGVYLPAIADTGNGRLFCSDSSGTAIITTGNIGSTAGTSISAWDVTSDPTNTPLWTKTFTRTILSIACRALQLILVEGSAATSYTVHGINTSSGSDIWTCAPTALYIPVIQAIGDDGNWWSRPLPLSSFANNPTTVRRPITGAVVDSSTWTAADTSARAGPGCYCDAGPDVSLGKNVARATINTTCANRFVLTSIAGASFGTSGTVSSGTTHQLFEACSDTTGDYNYPRGPSFYYSGRMLIGSGGAKFHLFKVDSGGLLEWTQTFSTYRNALNSSPGAICYGLGISDDGYLYAGGTVVSP